MEHAITKNPSKMKNHKIQVRWKTNQPTNQKMLDDSLDENNVVKSGRECGCL